MTDWDTNDPFAVARREEGVLEADVLGERIPMILRYRDVRAAAGDYATYSSDAPFRVPIPSEEAVREVRQLPRETDPPDHGDYRAIVQPFFSAPNRPETIAAIEALVEGMLDEVLDAESVEIVEHFALPLQSRALTVLLGMPMEEADEWTGWGQHVFHGAEGQSADKGDALSAYLDRQFNRAEASPGGDFFSALTKATFRDRSLTRDEKLGFANLAFAGGRDTVISTVSLALAHLAEHPGDMARLRADSRLVRSMVEEVVRIASPLTMTGRTCPHATDVQGVEVAAGQRAGLCWASANHDETVFENPERLDIGRRRNPHIAFGAGPHTCLGASHARLLLRTLIRQAVDRCRRLTLGESQPRYEEWPDYRRQTGFDMLRLRFEA